jgi:hypothetical protein
MRDRVEGKDIAKTLLRDSQVKQYAGQMLGELRPGRSRAVATADCSQSASADPLSGRFQVPPFDHKSAVVHFPLHDNTRSGSGGCR